MNPLGYFTEDSLPVRWLAYNKTRSKSGGLTSEYILRNGWVARRKKPESQWRDYPRWTIMSDGGKEVLGGSERKLTKAIAVVFNFGPRTPAVLNTIAKAQRQTSINSNRI